ncbi:MAG: hypothetical protein R6X17_15650, partial [Candidatus Competibacteraceae bacterium]
MRQEGNYSLTLLATDLELQISTQLESAKSGEDFAVTVAARKLFDIGDELVLHLDGREQSVLP